MIKRIKPFKINEEQKINMEIAEWAWQSHYWIESYPGYAQCKWCDRYHTSEMGIDRDFPLCPQNYAIKKYIDRKIMEAKVSSILP